MLTIQGAKPAVRVMIEHLIGQNLSFWVHVGDIKAFGEAMGFPDHIVAQFRSTQVVPLFFDTRFRHVYGIEVTDAGFLCNLSFDTLYWCRIPWGAIVAVVVTGVDAEVVWPTEWSDQDCVQEKPGAPVPGGGLKLLDGGLNAQVDRGNRSRGALRSVEWRKDATDK